MASTAKSRMSWLYAHLMLSVNGKIAPERFEYVTLCSRETIREVMFLLIIYVLNASITISTHNMIKISIMINKE